MNERLYQELYEELKADEGYKKYPYICPAGKITIGIGHNLEDNGLSDTVILKIFMEDLEAAVEGLQAIFGPKLYNSLPNQRQKALINMMFNLGYARFKGFKKMIAAIKSGDWDKAADEALNSKWARVDVPSRAKKIAQALRYQDWQN